MADVVLSGAMRSNLLSMQNTARLLDQTQMRVATGLKVNTAVDNPQSYFTAQGLDNRASDLSTLLDNMGLAVQTLKAASQGIDAIQKLVQQAKATAIQALQTTIVPATDSATFAATDFSVSGAAKTLVFTVGDASAVTVNLTSNITSVGDLQTALTAAGYSAVTVSLDKDGKIEFSGKEGQDFTVSGTAVGGMIDTSLAATNGVNRNAQVDSYNALLDQIDQLASDASFNGINLLENGAELVVNFNERQTSQMTLKGIDSSFAGLKLAKLDYSDFATNDAIKAVQATDDKSISMLRVNATGFASSLSIVQSRQDFTQNIINTLRTGSGNLTLADTNEEGANLLALQTRQQLGTSALSIANQSQQSILKLF